MRPPITKFHSNLMQVSLVPHTAGQAQLSFDNVRSEPPRCLHSKPSAPVPPSVQQAMNEVQDEKLSQLVSLGGWLRGTEVLTAVVTKKFSDEGAELLHQPDLLDYFQTKLEVMPQNYNVSIVREIQQGLVEVKPLINVGKQRISPQSVKKINEITTRLDYGIVTKE